MLNERQIEMLPERIYQRLNRVNSECLQDIGGIIKEIGELRPSDTHKLQQIYSYGANGQKMAEKLAKESAKNIEEIYEIFDIVAKENYNYAKPFYKAKDKPFIPYEENEDLKRYVKSLAKQTVNEYVNLTQHTAFAVFDPDGKSIAPLFDANKGKMATSLSDTYTKVIDYAVTKVQMGVSDYNSAVRDVVESLAKSGIKTVDYATGYSRRLDTAVRQNVLWGIKQCNQNTADLIGEDFGANGYEISYHSNPRPSHADMGGKQYAIGKARTIKGVHYPSFSDVESLLEDFGCLHFKFSILLGVSEPAYSKEQLAEFKASDNRTFEFEGKEYTGYEATQMQRKIETAIRNQKDLAITAKAAGDDDLRQKAQQKINLLASKYDKFSKAADLPTKMERLDVKGFRSVKIKAENVESGISKKHIYGTSENKVDLEYIASKEYRTKFYELPYDEEVCESVYKQAKAIITHRNGTYFEDICLIDSKNGNVLVKSFNNKSENEVKYSPRAEKVVAENEHSLIAIHNHGTNNPPTGSDFVSAANRKYKKGIVACHNGDVYMYNVGKKPFSSRTFDKRVDNYLGKGYNEVEAIVKTLDYYSKHYGIEWRLL